MAADWQRVIRFIEGSLRNTKGKFASSPFIVYDFQREVIQECLALDRHGRRKVREYLLGVARKNGKTELIAALALALLILDGEPGGDVIIAAGKRDQAKILFGACQKMVKNGRLPSGRPLSDFIEVRRDAIYYPALDAKLFAVSADAQNEQGLNPNIAIVDELHVASEKNRDLYDALMTGQGARENPLMIALTTAGPMPTGPCHDLYAYGKEIERGVRTDPDFRMRWYEAPEGIAVDDPAGWEAANPAIDKFLYRAFLEKESRAVLSGKKPEYTFRRLHLNNWTTALERWLPYAKWLACALPPCIDEGQGIIVGIDAALSRDTFGVAWIRVESRTEMVEENGLYAPRERKYVHARGKKFVPWAPGGYIDPEEVKTFILGLAAQHPVEKVLYDPAYMGLLASELADRGVPMEPFPQTAEKMTRATETLQRVVLDGRMYHGNDPTLNEQMAGVGVKPGERGVRISKARSGVKVDVITALVMAMDYAIGDELSEPEDFFFTD